MLTDRFKPSEAKFIGSPIDYVIFESIDTVDVPDSGPVVVWFVEVKTGNAGLTQRERKIQEAVDKGAVHFDVLRLPVTRRECSAAGLPYDLRFFGFRSPAKMSYSRL